jgi:hypothetical protein
VTPDSLNPDKVRYYVEKGLLSKRIDQQPERLLSELVMPPRTIAFAILEDCRLSDVYNEEMAEEFAKELLVNREYYRVTIRASEVDEWAREWRFDRGIC